MVGRTSKGHLRNNFKNGSTPKGIEEKNTGAISLDPTQSDRAGRLHIIIVLVDYQFLLSEAQINIYRSSQQSPIQAIAQPIPM